MENIRIIMYKDADKVNNEYAVCECTSLAEGIEVPRKDYDDFVRFNCPRCGKKLGLFVRGKSNYKKGKIFGIDITNIFGKDIMIKEINDENSDE